MGQNTTSPKCDSKDKNECDQLEFVTNHLDSLEKTYYFLETKSLEINVNNVGYIIRFKELKKVKKVEPNGGTVEKVPLEDRMVFDVIVYTKSYFDCRQNKKIVELKTSAEFSKEAFKEPLARSGFHRVTHGKLIPTFENLNTFDQEFKFS